MYRGVCMVDSQTARLLLVDDDSDSSLSLSRGLKASGLEGEIRVAANGEKAIQLVREWDPHVAVIDLCLNPSEGVEGGFRLLSQLANHNSLCRVIVLTGNACIENGIRALNSGAASFLEKPVDIKHIHALLYELIKQSRLRREYELLKNKQDGLGIAELVVGQSKAMDSVRQSLLYAASTTQAVLLTGETGTGKGLCALAIHRFGNRGSQRFVRYQPNFSSADLVNSDLFGHTKGAFTGAWEDRKGLISEAHQGTLFLDEIDELPLETQVTLLGVLQERKYRPMGCNKESEANFRLISASNQDIGECLESGRLRRDFYHRAAHQEIRIPPLRERMEDIEELSRFVLAKLRDREEVQVFDISHAATDMLMSFNWPGNVRQLESVVEGAAFRTQYHGRTCISEEDIEIPGQIKRTSSHKMSFNEQVQKFKLELINTSLAKNSGNQVKAAQELGLDRSTLRRILNR